MKLGSRKPAVIAAAAAVGVAAVAIGITASQSASAASANPSATPSGRPTGAPGTPGGPGGGPGGWGGPGGPGGPGGLGGHRGPGGPGGQLLHGEEVVQQGTKVVTIEEQVGKVTAVSATSITVKSTDGYTATYVVASTTQVGKSGASAKITAVKVGDTVRVEGTKAGSTVTATHVMDGLPPMRAGDGDHGRWPGPGAPSGAPAAPSAGGTA